MGKQTDANRKAQIAIKGAATRSPGPDPVSRSDGRGSCIVGIGASAGGLEALEAFFSQMPADSGLVFVVVQHLDPDHKSILVDLLARRTAMEVIQVEDRMRVKPNGVYVIPPHKYLTLLQDVLHLLEPDPPQGFRLPIDFFFRSLSEDSGEKAIGIILSGTGMDGALGIKAIKGAGGITMAQEEGSAKFGSMPKSAIDTGCVDYVFPPEQMPQELMKYVRHPYIAAPLWRNLEAPILAKPERLDKIFILLRSHTGHDFSQYKRNTIGRRIERRMAVHQIGSLDDYIRFLDHKEAEIDALFKDLLIGVTSFFRDAEAFETLREQVARPVVAQRSAETPIRVWVAGCSTGEEAYSFSILLREEIDTSTKDLKIQIFATDIDSHALDIAREGVYPNSIAADVSPQRLTRFFTKEGAHYRINKPIRDTVVFAKQDLIKDSPFSKLDLIVCRNLLIYMTGNLQRKILPLFHYTLNPTGFLMLGPSETVGDFADLFALIDSKWKIFQAKRAVRPVEVPITTPQIRDVAVNKRAGVHPMSATNLGQRFEKILLEHHTSPCVIINEKYDILHFHGQTSGYLNSPTGAATFNLLKMAREGLRVELRTALHKAFKNQTRVVYAAVRAGEKGTPRTVNLIIEPFEQEFVPGLMMVIFEEVMGPATTSKAHKQPQKGTSWPDQRIADLEGELNSTKEELDTAREEFTSTNEELQSINEELQSTNEEMETSKEELQSVNEELQTVNTELQSKLDELSQTNNDIQNLLNSTQIGTIFLDTHLRIRRFTPTIIKLFKLIPGDIGRPLDDLASHLIDDAIVSDATEVLQTLATKEQERQSKEGEWFLVRMFPYRTLTNVIDGIVITFTDISELKRQKQAAEANARYAEGIIGAMWEPLLVLNKALQVVSANSAYYDTFGIGKYETEGRLVYELGNGQWNIPELKRLLEEILPQDSAIDNFEMEHTFQQIGRKKMSVKARRLVLAADKDKDELILLAIRDLTPGSRL